MNFIFRNSAYEATKRPDLKAELHIPGYTENANESEDEDMRMKMMLNR